MGAEELKVSNRGIKALPERFSSTCSSLRCLELTALQLRSLPASRSRPPAPLQSSKDNFGHLSSLQSLVIERCKLNELPRRGSSLTSWPRHGLTRAYEHLSRPF